MRKILISVIFLFLVGLFFMPNGNANTATNKGVSKMEEMKQYTEVRARHILVGTKEEAETIKKRVEAGEEKFEDAARAHSKCPSGTRSGGDLGYFKRGQMVPEFDKAAFSLPEGKVSEPVQTQFGWHLIEVTDRK